MYVIGWCSATGCSQPGIDATGAYALETNVSGNTMNARFCAACALPDTMPSATNTHSNANPNARIKPKLAASADNENESCYGLPIDAHEIPT